MFKQVKRLAVAASVATVVAAIAVTSTTAGVASARVLGTSGIEANLSPVAWSGRPGHRGGGGQRHVVRL